MKSLAIIPEQGTDPISLTSPLIHMRSLLSRLSPLFLVGAPLVTAATAPSCSEARVPFSLASSGYSCDSGDLGIHTGGLRISSAGPAVFYGSIRRGPSERSYSFVVLVNTDGAPRTSRGMSEFGSAVCNGGELVASTLLTVDGVSFEATHRAEASENQSAILEETLTLQGQVVDPSLGRLFLMEYAHPEKGLRQLDVPLPEAPGPTEDYEAITDALVEHLISEHEEVRAFLEG